ncbi:hypothetical protein [Yunchengibacter salinarum]|uniref:hypothetical protein n=1 Tax=Yunchengibacter salinarum TaxID=3133399 RepID=UPI0035B65AD5
MAYTDYYLHADSEADMATALPWARTVDDEGAPVWRTRGPGWALEVAVPVVETPATIDTDTGEVIAPASLAPGFHANLRTDGTFAETVPDTLITTPATPQRVWA